MATTKGRLSLSFLAAALVAAPAMSADHRVAASADRLSAMRVEMGLDQDHGFALRHARPDELGMIHSRFQQTFRGVKVFGGEVITHMDKEGRFLSPTQEHRTNIRVNTTPSLSPTEALAVAHGDLAPKGGYAHDPKAELVIYPEMREVVRRGAMRPDGSFNGADVTRQVVRYTLAYHVRTELENGADETIHRDYLINAHNGAVIKTWDNLHTAGATGTGRSQYSGTVNLSTNSIASGYELSDVVRTMPFKTYNLNHATSGTGTIFTDADNTWGDGANYVEGSSTTAANGQTAGVDAHYGTQVSFDFFKNVMGRNGIDGAGRAAYNRVHYSNNYDNAFWSDSCFCMTYGDGSSFTTLTALDVAAHEMSHGVCANEANLVYSGESGGLNESNSDIFGAVVEIYARNGNTLPATVSNTDNAWKIGEQLNANPLRYMFKPSKDGSSPDAWYSGIGNIDVHYNSGPNNRMFFFLSQGASSTAGDFNSTYLPGGMTGIGVEKAAKIWYRALANYLTSSSNYAAARTACISSAKDLYGAGGAEEQAVWNAFAAINVGSPWSNGGPVITGQPANASVQAGSTATFSVTATGSALSYQWRKNGTAISGATAASYTTPATTTADNGATFSVVVSNASGSVTSNNATLTVTTTPQGNNEVEPNNTSGTAQVVSTSGTTLNGTAGSSTDQDWFKVTLGAGRTITATLTPNASSDYDLYLYNSNLTQIASSVNGTGAVDTVSKTNTGSSAFARYVKVIYYSGTTGAAGTYTLKLTF